MLKCASGLIAVSLLVTFGFAKEKNKNTLPAYVLHAHTVAVIIDPEARMSIDGPGANQEAQKNVEAALLNWGRFEPVPDTRSADLIVVVRKGNRHLADDTTADPRQTDRAGAISPIDTGVRMGGQNGPAADALGEPSLGPRQQTPQPASEIGEADDSFVVFQGGVENPFNAAPAWRYVAKDGLSAGGVPAVATFRKAVENADKAAAKKP